ncbi:MAG TPA: group III truncated hemoglobin [Rhodanobacteraceae bacterium]|nr:group III truncated hemoglobin [Rhodanobacteraceae bacterium]
MARRGAARDAGGMSNAIPATLDEAGLAGQVERFYDKVRIDPLLGPVFNAVVEDWDAHKVLMTSFWATVALRSGHYRGNPLAKHRPLPIGAEHFQRWLTLWRETAGEVLDAESAALLVGYAERIGYGMRVGMGLTGHLRGRESGIPVRSRAAGTAVSPAR